MIGPVVEAPDGGTEMYGLQVSDLQSGIVIDDEGGQISGTSKHVESYPLFSSHIEEQSGNFLALSLSASEGVTITTSVVNGTGKAPVTVSDGYCVYRITDKDTQSIKVTFTKGDTSVEKTYALTGLECLEE